MAIYHLNARGVAPARGSSAVRSAAYQSGERLVSERTGDVCEYARAERVVATGIELPEAAPEWARDRGSLWNAAEAAWAGGNELVCRRYEFALPRELPREWQLECVASFCELFPDRARDWAVHDSGDGNPHAHVLVSALPMGADGFERPAARRSTKVYLCRDTQGRDVLVAADDWRAAKAEGIEKVYTFRDGRRLSMSEAKAEGLTKADRRTKAPVAMTRAAAGGRAFDAERAELRRIRAEWARIANERLADVAELTGTERVAIDHRSFAERAAAARGESPEAAGRVARELDAAPAWRHGAAGPDAAPRGRCAAAEAVPGSELLPRYDADDPILDAAPTVHEGPAVAAAEARAREAGATAPVTELRARNEGIRRANALLAALCAELGRMRDALARAARRVRGLAARPSRARGAALAPPQPAAPDLAPAAGALALAGAALARDGATAADARDDLHWLSSRLASAAAERARDRDEERAELEAARARTRARAWGRVEPPPQRDATLHPSPDDLIRQARADVMAERTQPQQRRGFGRAR
ncbi:MAG: MobA/MobL family protein [Coriobacteriaceae bacterium]|nr:MobA/MobL family protein [Coriobacteriaceae bacterium]